MITKFPGLADEQWLDCSEARGTIALFGKEVKVKAYLLEIYQCPPCPKKQTCKLCDQPHFFMSDQPNGKKEKALMIVDYLMPQEVNIRRVFFDDARNEFWIGANHSAELLKVEPLD